MNFLEQQLAQQESLGLTRHLESMTRKPFGFIELDGKSFVDFSSNDYLGLNFNQELTRRYCEGLEKYGIGSGGSPAVSGFDKPKAVFQKAFAEFTDFPEALFFSSGYVANLSVMSTLIDEGADIFIDKFSHASIYDGLKLKGLQFKRYHHCDLDHLERLLNESKAKTKWIVSEGVFSMTGRMAPIEELIRLKQQTNAYLLIDDAHGIGVLGEEGGGSLSQLPTPSSKVDVLVCPLGKAFSSAGAVVCASELIIQGLVQFARPYRYSTALPSALSHVLNSVLALVQKGMALRQKLQQNIALFKELTDTLPYKVLPSNTAIQMLTLADNKKAQLLSLKLREDGFFCYAMRSPTVPSSYSGLRVVLSVAHSEGQIRDFCKALRKGCDEITH